MLKLLKGPDGNDSLGYSEKNAASRHSELDSESCALKAALRLLGDAERCKEPSFVGRPRSWSRTSSKPRIRTSIGSKPRSRNKFGMTLNKIPRQNP